MDKLINLDHMSIAELIKAMPIFWHILIGSFVFGIIWIISKLLKPDIE